MMMSIDLKLIELKSVKFEIRNSAVATSAPIRAVIKSMGSMRNRLLVIRYQYVFDHSKCGKHHSNHPVEKHFSFSSSISVALRLSTFDCMSNIGEQGEKEMNSSFFLLDGKEGGDNSTNQASNQTGFPTHM